MSLRYDYLDDLARVNIPWGVVSFHADGLDSVRQRLAGQSDVVFIEVSAGEIASAASSGDWHRLFGLFLHSLRAETVPNKSWDAFLDVLSYCVAEVPQSTVVYALTGADSLINSDVYLLIQLTSLILSRRVHLAQVVRKRVLLFVVGGSSGFKDLTETLRQHNPDL